MTNPSGTFPPPAHPSPNPRTLLGQLRSQVRVRLYSFRTEQAYAYWVRRYVRHHGGRHPRDLGPEDLKGFLSDLAEKHRVAASTQNQALSALLFLYKDVLGMELPWLDGIKKAKRPRRLPVVLTREEARALLARMEGTHGLMARLLYGTGMRLREMITLRVKDMELARREIVIREAKGGKDRMTVLPSSLVEPLREHLTRVNTLFLEDRARNLPPVELPGAYGRKNPAAGRLWGWHWVFPQRTIAPDPRTGIRRRHHANEQSFSRALSRAAREAGLVKPVTAHTMRHSFATHLMESGYDIRTVQELLGHKDVSTTMIYTHVLNRGGRGVVSPLDR
ncbi:MAG: integron integrase [Betaproteobacteria bacterium]|nr:integron integrase [Betaproteobacteria bacterium]